MQTEQKEIKIIIKNKHFRWLGWLLIFMSTISIVLEQTKSSVYIKLIGIILGVIILISSMTRKEIRLITDKIEYWNTTKKKILFSVKYADINLLRTFIDTNNKSKNLTIYTDEKQTISFSSSYINESDLLMVWNELVRRCKVYIDKSELTVENELNW